MPAPFTHDGIAHERAGPRGDVLVVLLHAGVADRRMWEPLWPSLTTDRDVLRVDLRGFGGSASPPLGILSHADDVLSTLDGLGLRACHLVGASLGAGVAVEVALTRPALVRSLLLAGPGGPLLGELTPDLAAFVRAEREALAGDDLDAAVAANLAWWVDGPHRTSADVDPALRDLVAVMQRRAFEVTDGWDDVEERELDPPALDRLAEVLAPTLVLLGSLDLDAVHQAAHRLAGEIPGARLVTWSDTAHLLSLERPAEFVTLLREHVRRSA